MANEDSIFIKSVSFFESAAEACNAGIFYQILGTFGIVFTNVGTIPIICDALIYFFRACANVTVAIGQSTGVEFPGRAQSTHKKHILINLLSILLFLGAVSVIVASIFSTAVSLPFIGWFMGLAGVSCSWIINHCQLVYDLRKRGASTAEINTAVHSRNLYAGILLFVAISLLCSTATAIFPPAAPFLLLTAKIAGGCLGVINLGRVVNYFQPTLFSSIVEKISGLWKRLTQDSTHTGSKPHQATSYTEIPELKEILLQSSHADTDLLNGTPDQFVYRRADNDLSWDEEAKITGAESNNLVDVRCGM